jgi:predicted metal-binding membrane protein
LVRPVLPGHPAKLVQLVPPDLQVLSVQPVLPVRKESVVKLVRLLRRDRVIVGIALLILILSAWLYVGRLATSIEVAGIDMTGTRMASTGTRMVLTSSLEPWSRGEFAFMFLMWAAMMVAMMLPSATPMVLRYARAGRATAFDTNPIDPTGWFAAGYLLVWLVFSFVATDAQWALERAGLLHR